MGDEDKIQLQQQLNKLEADLIATKRERDLAILSAASADEKLQDILSAASDWIWEMDGSLRFTTIQDQFFETTGMTPEDIIGKTRRELHGDNPTSPNWIQHEELLLSKRPFRDFKVEHTKSDGQVVHVSLSGVPKFDNSGNFQGYRALP